MTSSNSSNSYWTSALTASASNFATDPTAVLHSHLASALSTLGDAQYWEESISPQEIRQLLSEADASNPSSVPALLKGLKWLLASISKGRDVSDFYVLVVKLVACPCSMEVRKMVYTYLVQYADHNATTRELSLLSINSFQRGLHDSEPLIRALALRVLTSVQLPDILAIQVLAVTKHAAHDTSPYVRKCAAMAVSKLYPRCASQQQQHSDSANHDNNNAKNDQQTVLLELIQQLLDQDTTTMVLSSALMAFQEITAASTDYLHLIHGSFRKLCHLLTDMDEWGQVVAMEVLTRYARHFFREPRYFGINGSAEQIDAARRVVRRWDAQTGKVVATAPSNAPPPQHHATTETAATAASAPGSSSSSTTSLLADRAAAAGVTLPPRASHHHHHHNHHNRRNIIKRRVVKKGFYSDEEDDSTDEEVFADTLESASGPLSSALRQPDQNDLNNAGTISQLNGNLHEEEADLDEDHRLLLHSALPLLKSRNAGVVLAVCSLHYYCGVSSIPIRKAMGKALVRIHRDRHREIQYVVLTSIRRLVRECPSAFSPFLNDFFVLPDMDPPFTRLIKLDILTSLALDPPSIQTVLRELRTYVQLPSCDIENDDDDNHADAEFVRAAVRAVGRVAEMARIVYDRHGAAQDRAQANTVALNGLYGLLTFLQTAAPQHHEVVVGECVAVLQRIWQMLQSDNGGGGVFVQDPNGVQERVLRRILLLLVHTLSCLADSDDEEDESESVLDEDGDEDDNKERTELEQVALVLPPGATASALWWMGEYLAPPLSTGQSSSSAFGKFDAQGRARLRLELVRLLVRCFLELEAAEKEQAVHFASKLLVSSAAPAADERALCEQVLALGRLDVHPDVRDRARFESGLVHVTVGLQHDRDALDNSNNEPASLPSPLLNSSSSSSSSNVKKLTVQDAQRILLSTKPASSYLPLDLSNNGSNSRSNGEEEGFRFGTLSSLVGHQARSAYLPLPPWAAENSPSSLRQPPVPRPESNGNRLGGPNDGGEFYHSSASSSSSSDSDDDSSSSESSSSGSGEDDQSSGSSSDSSSSDTDSSDEDNERVGVLLSGGQPVAAEKFGGQTASVPQHHSSIPAERASGDSSSSSSSDESSSSSDSESRPATGDLLSSSAAGGNLIPMGGDGGTGLAAASSKPAAAGTTINGGSSSSVADDLKGLVMAPVVVEPTDTNFDRDSGAWVQLVRPEHAKGLSVQARYLRGVTKAQQATQMGLTSDKPTVVCLQVRFENQKDGSSGPVRHLRILQRSVSSSSSVIGPRKVVVPPEMNQVAVGQKSECLVGIDFAGASDRDGSLHAKLEIKFGSGGMPVDIKPSIGDLLLPCRRSVAEFDAAVSRMHGFNRVESKFSVAGASREEQLPRRLLSRVALSVVGGNKLAWDGDKLRLAGTLPASSDPVYVLTTCSVTGQGKIVVCCDHALVVNSIMNLLKRAIAEGDE